jgi:DNA-binding transcriptional LysR family regulator
MLDRFTSLEALAKVAATGSFSAAGRALGLSQTMITKHVAALEERLGARLFHRTTRKVSITDAGQTYLEAASRALAELEAAEDAIAADRIEPRGLLRVAAPVSFGVRRLAPLIPRFSRRYPKVAVELGLNDRLVDLVDEGWDVAVRIGILRDSSLVARRLAPCRTILCAAPAYLVAHAAPRTVADLSRHNCLSYTLSRFTGAGRWMFGANREVEVGVSGDLRANSGDALRLAAVAGQGLIYEPTFIVADDLSAGRLVAIALDHPPIELGAIHAVYPGGRHPPAKVRAFIDFLAELYSPEPPWDRAPAPRPA